jgi:hypothetical protein
MPKVGTHFACQIDIQSTATNTNTTPWSKSRQPAVRTTQTPTGLVRVHDAIEQNSKIALVRISVERKERHEKQGRLIVYRRSKALKKPLIPGEAT